MLGCLTVHAWLAWAVHVPALGTGQDDARYLLLGRALRGLSYRELWDVATPVHSLYPPAYPAVLALLGLRPGDPVPVAIVANITCSVAALGMLFLLLRPLGPWLALATVAVAAVNPALVDSAATVRSEPLYMLLSLVALVLAEQDPATPRRTAGAIMAALLATLTRSIGLTLVLALMLRWVLARRYRPLAALLVACVLVLGPWFAWTVPAPRQLAGQSYLGDAQLQRDAPAAPQAPVPAPPAPAARPVTPPPTAELPAAPREDVPEAAGQESSAPRSLGGTLRQRVRANLTGYLVAGVPGGLALPTVGGTAIDNWAWVLLVTGTGLVGAWSLGRDRRATALYLGCYAALLVVWPYRLPRFLVPVLPLVAGTMLLGARGLLAWRSPRGAGLLVGGLALLLAGAGIRAGLGPLALRRGCDHAAPYASAGCFTPRQRAFFAAVARVRSEVPDSAVLLTPKAGTVYYLTGRRTVNELEAATLEPAALRAFLRAQGAEYVLLSRIHLDQWTLARRLVAVCEDFALVGEGEAEALLLRLRPPGQAPGAGAAAACDAVRRFAAGPWPDGP